MFSLDKEDSENVDQIRKYLEGSHVEEVDSFELLQKAKPALMT
jgi:hypothetical protein